MTPAHVPNDQVFVAWISTIADFTADGVGTLLPEDTSAWSANGYVVVPVTVGGTPHSTMPMRRPVGQVDCRAVSPGTEFPPWGKAADLAEQIRFATYDRNNFGRPLTVTVGGNPFPDVMVRSAKILTEPHRMYADGADYAGYSFDLALQWVQVGEVVR